MKQFYFPLLALGLLQALPGRCQLLEKEVFHANSIRTGFLSNGALFFTQTEEQTFQVPFQDLSSSNTIFAGGLWLGAMDGSQLKVSAQYYQAYAPYYNPALNAFLPGPVNPATGKPYDEDDIQKYNRIWSVGRQDILRHIADFNENTFLDEPILSIVGWPGHGNPYFHEVNGFDWPNTPQGEAPFYDRSSDGIYNAFDGDYPLPEAVAPGVIPEQILWLVFNDAFTRAPNTEEFPLGVEVQLTAWAFFAEGDPLLNRTLFTSYKIINRSGKDLQDFRCGIWTDIDVGCYLNDYAGCIPSLNAHFGYNATPLDEDCNNYPGYDSFPPVQAVTLLDQPVSGFISMQNPLWAQPDPNMSDPSTHEEVWHYLNSRWRSGEPLTPGGNGYNPSSTLEPVKFAFPGDPNDPAGWSQFSQNLPHFDERGLGIIEFGNFQNGELKSVALAYSTHQDSALNHVQQVGLLYDEIPQIQQLYAERFAHLVLEPLCDTSCVWPGDANRDGIANHLDLVAIAAGKDTTGHTRNSPLNWSPHLSEDWSQNLANGLNFKHLDCDGDGIVQPLDFEVTKVNYGLTSEQYVNFDAYPVGTELYFEPQAKIADNIVAQEDGVYFIKVKMKPIPNLSALAFTVEYDPRFPHPQVITTANQLQNSYYFTSQHPSRDFPFSQTWDVDFAVMRLAQGGNFAENFLVFLRFGQPSAPLPSTRTLFRFKNVRAVLDDGTEIFIGGEWLTLFFHGYELEEQAVEPTGIVVFPNPSDGVFYVRMKMEELNGYQLFDLAGRRLAVDAQFREGDFMVDLRRLAAGIYFLEINREGKRHVRKLVVN